MPQPSFFVVEENKLVVLGIPKVGCTSIKAAILKERGVDVSEAGFNIHHKKHFTYIRGNQVREYAAKGYVVATFVRDPYERFMSFYLQKIYKPNKFVKKFKADGFYTGMPFRRAVLRVIALTPDMCDHHFKAQAAILDEADMTPQFVGRLESFEEDWKKLSDMLPTPLPDLPHLNNTGIHPDLWTHETRGQISARYCADFNRFGYTR